MLLGIQQNNISRIAGTAVREEHRGGIAKPFDFMTT
jgi:hypothetical protein